MSERLYLLALLAALAPGGPLTGRIRFQTRLGGSGNETVRAMGRDSDGNFYVAGSTMSRDFPATAGDPSPRGSNLYRVRNGVFESVPALGSGSGSFNASCMVAPPSIPGLLVAAIHDPDASETGLFRSTNGGSDWTRIDHGLPRGFGCSALLFDSSTGAIHLNDSGVVWTRTLDEAWTRRPAPWGDRRPYRFTSHPSAPNSIVAYFFGAWFSNDGGESWARTHDDIRAIAIVASRPGLMYGIADKQILRSTDAGKSWSPVSQGPPLAGEGTSSFVADPSHVGTLYWSGGSISSFESWQSRDEGATWTPFRLGGDFVTSIVAGPVSGTSAMDKGSNAGQTRLLAKLLEQKFGPLPEWVRAKLDGAGSEALERWGERFDASSLAGVFGEPE